MSSRPTVSVVVPMLNEHDHIAVCLEGFVAQTYPQELLDVIVVDGGSTDGSRELVLALAETHPCIRLVDNPKGRASAAFNVGVDAAKGDVVCLFSAHGHPSPDYVEASVRVLDETGAAGVGGRYEHVGEDRVSRAIGLAMASPFGMASVHRYATARTEVDTISHPAYRREALRAIGPFDESLLRNSDYELNWRLRAAGERLVFDPSISSIYRPRPSLAALRQQFWMYGQWKVRVVQRHPASLKLRHLVAPAAVATAGCAPLLLLSRRGRSVVIAAALAYGTGTMVAVARAKPGEHDASPVVLAASYPVMHGAWGAGFLAALFRRRSS